MTNLAEHFPSRRPATAGSQAAEPVTPADASLDITPQDFYHELAERPDVRRILTRLAQVEDERAARP